MNSTDILTNVVTFIVGLATGGGVTFFSMNKNSSKNSTKVNQNGNAVGGDLTGGNKNEK